MIDTALTRSADGVRAVGPELRRWVPFRFGRALRRLCWAVTLLVLLGWQEVSYAQKACRPDWPLWEQFTQRLLTDDGRVVDDSVATKHSTSESQSYGMFFALVANDRERFDRMWQWSLNNLLGGTLGEELPAWQWGLGKDGAWSVLDGNAASDGNVWFAYALIEAARLWNEPRYRREGLHLARLVAEQEWAALPGFGLQLLPAPFGFYDEATQTWRLNPSYLVLPQLRLLARQDTQHDWNALAPTTLAMIREVSPRGLVPDWVAYRAESADRGSFIPDPLHGSTGSYDAIRTYLWAGVTSSGDPLSRALRQALFGMTALTKRLGHVPEIIDTATGQGQGKPPLGFAAALLPLWSATGQFQLVYSHVGPVRERFERWQEANLPPPAYYDMMLAMFGLGWYDQHYRFAADGSLLLRWKNSC